ncbi:hypothetical protein VF21_01432 [Pseudogymnoascus sp. 05NY08]|nr:hypothetical protein VF21_01432 [Pseudogymnoascus sp. 05NY08]
MLACSMWANGMFAPGNFGECTPADPRTGPCKEFLAGCWGQSYPGTAALSRKKTQSSVANIRYQFVYVSATSARGAIGYDESQEG